MPCSFYLSFKIIFLRIQCSKIIGHICIFTGSLSCSHKFPGSLNIPFLPINHKADNEQLYYSFLYLNSFHPIAIFYHSSRIASPSYSTRINKETGIVVRLILTQSGRVLQRQQDLLSLRVLILLQGKQADNRLSTQLIVEVPINYHPKKNHGL